MLVNVISQDLFFILAADTRRQSSADVAEDIPHCPSGIYILCFHIFIFTIPIILTYLSINLLAIVNWLVWMKDANDLNVQISR